MGIIRKIEELTDVNSVVISMNDLNKYNIKQSHPKLPALDELTYKLSAATLFSKLTLNDRHTER